MKITLPVIGHSAEARTEQGGTRPSDLSLPWFGPRLIWGSKHQGRAAPGLQSKVVVHARVEPQAGRFLCRPLLQRFDVLLPSQMGDQWGGGGGGGTSTGTQPIDILWCWGRSEEGKN